MIELDQRQRRLRLPPSQLGALAQLATAQQRADIPDHWVDAGIVADGEVHPIAAAVALVAVAPDRAIAIERLAGASIAPLMVGWDRFGRATMTEHEPADDGRVDGEERETDSEAAEGGAAGDGHLTITATHFELLPALLLQAVGLFPDHPAAAGDRIDTTAGVIDDAIADLARGGVFGSLEAPDALIAVLEHGETVLRATGSWAGRPADTSITLLLAGTRGVWLVERDDPTPSRDTVVQLVPSDVATAAALLGDVVTGRRVRSDAAA